MKRRGLRSILLGNVISTALLVGTALRFESVDLRGGPKVDDVDPRELWFLPSAALDPKPRPIHKRGKAQARKQAARSARRAQRRAGR